MLNEADTCRRFVVPRLQQAGWDDDRIAEQRTFTDGRIIVTGRRTQRRPGKRADYLLRYRPDFPIAVVEAKPRYKTPGDGLQQAKNYAEILGLNFAYSTNGRGIVEFDYLTGRERELDAFPSPDELWARLTAAQGLSPDAAERLLTPSSRLSGKPPRYYQEIAINRTVQAILQGQRRVLLTMATGTGKTLVAFQICWKLWSARWNRTCWAENPFSAPTSAGRDSGGTEPEKGFSGERAMGERAMGERKAEYRRPRILYLADRNILVDGPKDKDFAVFGDARCKIENGIASKSREIYFAIYQAIAQDERRPGLYREYAPDFFDLIIVDECHRGSARDESNWRDILEYFEPAYQLGMTATPLREDNRDTYRYFGDPLYTYSLRQGIEDGFLAPYRVHRIITEWDAAGWRPSQGDLDRYGREIPDEVYETADFERVVALKARTEAVAKHLSEFLKKTDRFAKTIVFCVDQEHADEMRGALSRLNPDLMRQNPDYVVRVTADEGKIGGGHLSNFMDVERPTPVIVTTSKLLTTGVDVPTCRNIVLLRVIRSMTEFKQIIGRGTRVRDDYGKLWFSILDYTGTATRMFADPEFDGEPITIDETPIDVEPEPEPPTPEPPEPEPPEPLPPEPPAEPRKFYFDGGQVAIAAQLVYELDPDGRQLRVVRFTDYAAEKVRTLFRNAAEMREAWADPEARAGIIEKLAERGVDFDELATAADQPDADPFDLLCFVAFNAPLRTRRERAQRLRSERKDFFDQYGPEARAVLYDLLDKYAEYGDAQFVIPDALELPPINRRGNVIEIAAQFGGEEQLAEAVQRLQSLLYAA
ncbi:MAG: DEAD/DEAH box helicase family protein [Planctomycetota bacterium]